MMKKVLFFLFFVCLLGNSILIYLLSDQLSLNDSKFLEFEKCPFCYGHSICRDLQLRETKLSRYNIELEDSIFNTYLFQSILNVKNVYFAIDAFTGNKMVIKKLAHNSELDEFDNNENNCMTDDNSCLNKAVKLYGQIIRKKLDENSFKKISNYLEIDFGRCFSSRLLDLMYERYFQTYSKSMKNIDNFFEDNLTILTILKINPEPIVLQILSKNNGWPFPEFFGSCGRINVESYEGKTIDQYYNSAFRTRIKIAKRLMETIKMLEYNESKIGVYLLDLGLENISYDEHNDKVYFIDAENVFLVDKLKIKTDFDEPLYSDFEDCGQYGDCLSFNLDRMCLSSKVDINIYSVCRNILSSYASDINHKNFLHSIPEEVNTIFELDLMLNECSTNKFKRFEIMENLIFSFKRILFLLNE